MALSQVITYADRIEAGQIGHQAVSLTNFDNNNEPAISAGSKIEIGGALFEAVGNEAITGWAGIANNSDVYIRLTVVGAIATAGFTITAPVWSLTKQGFYDAGETMRYIGGLYKDAGGNYTDKWLYCGGPEIRHGAIGTDAIRTTKIKNAAITDAKINKATGQGTQVIGASAQWVIPAGIYTMTIYTGSAALAVFHGMAWWPSNLNFSGGAVISDGSWVSFITGGAGATVYYRKLS